MSEQEAKKEENPPEEKKVNNEIVLPIQVSLSDQSTPDHEIFNLGGTYVKDSVSRKLREFTLLRNKLAEGWPGIYVPGCPSRKIIGSSESETSKLRLNLLNRFLKKLSKYKHLLESKEFQIFLDPKNEISSNDVTKKLSSLPLQTNEDLIKKYSLAFTDFDDNYDTREFKVQQVKFRDFLRECYPKIEKFRDYVKALKDKFEANKNDLANAITQIRSFEKDIVNEYGEKDESKLIFENPVNTQLNESIINAGEKMNNPYNKMYELILGDLLDIEGMLNAFDWEQKIQDEYDKLVKDYYECTSDITDLHAGKGGVFMFFGLTKKEDEIKAKTEEKDILEKKMHNLGQVIKIASFIMDQEIKTFKSNFINNYYNQIKSLQGVSMDNLQLNSQLWKNIENDPNVQGVKDE